MPRECCPLRAPVQSRQKHRREEREAQGADHDSKRTEGSLLQGHSGDLTDVRGPSPGRGRAGCPRLGAMIPKHDTPGLPCRRASLHAAGSSQGSSQTPGLTLQ